MSKKYNVGVIGYGWVATAHIPAINASSQAQVTAVYSSRPQDGAELSAKYGSPITAYTSLDTMLADDRRAWLMGPDGSWERADHGVDPTTLDSQAALRLHALAGATSSLTAPTQDAGSLEPWA